MGKAEHINKTQTHNTLKQTAKTQLLSFVIILEIYTNLKTF